MTYADKLGGLPIVVDSIVHQLFLPEERRHLSTIDRLVVENAQLGDERRPAFIFQGTVYQASSEKGRISRGYRVPSLHALLVPKMMEFLVDVSAVRRDKQMIYQAITRLVKTATNGQHLRDALPDCLVQFVPEIAQLPRKNAFFQVHSGDARFLGQLQKILPTIEMYSAASLLY